MGVMLAPNGPIAPVSSFSSYNGLYKAPEKPSGTLWRDFQISSHVHSPLRDLGAALRPPSPLRLGVLRLCPGLCSARPRQVPRTQGKSRDGPPFLELLRPVGRQCGTSVGRPRKPESPELQGAQPVLLSPAASPVLPFFQGQLKVTLFQKPFPGDWLLINLDPGPCLVMAEV